MSKSARVTRLFWEFFKISLLVIGGGYAIAAVADEVFGRRLKWLDEGEILDHLSIISTVPGLVAGNTAIYVGLKVAGRTGALAALVAVALPSYAIFTLVTLGMDLLPRDNPWLEGGFFGLRAALTGVIAGTFWRTLRRGMLNWTKGVGVSLAPLSTTERLLAAAVLLVLLATAATLCAPALLVFLCLGCICIGGGFPLVPIYMVLFVGAGAPLLGMAEKDFLSMMALTQLTPGPVSVNAATYFGHCLSGALGGLVATAALLTPSYFLMTGLLTCLQRFRASPLAHLLVAGLKPIALALMGLACWKFAGMSVWSMASGTFHLHPFGLTLAIFASTMIIRRKVSIQLTIVLCALAGGLTALLR